MLKLEWNKFDASLIKYNYEYTNDMMEIFEMEDTYFGEWLFSRLKTEAVQMLTTQR